MYKRSGVVIVATDFYLVSSRMWCL